MQMHITNKENYKKNLCIDHTLIVKEIDESIKFYNWDFILPSLPSGSILVGGYIRDIFLGRLQGELDVDIVVPSNASKIGQHIADQFKGKLIILDKERDVVRIIFKHISFDIATQIGDSIQIDLSSRDFSINAIAFSFDKKLLIDPLNGIKDLKLSLLRSNSNLNLIEDPLRILRCFRFVSELNFNIDSQLINFIKHHKNQLRMVSAERINYELQRIIKGENAIKAILMINKFKIFNYMQNYEACSLNNLEKLSHEEFNQFEIKQFLPYSYLSEILTESSLEKIKFRKSEISNIKLLIKWKLKLNNQSISELNEIERFDLHRELESILPAFIFYLPKNLHLDWLTRWRDKRDKLFHPSNLINGDIIKRYLKVQDGPLLGKLIYYLSMELAYNRLNNFDEAIYKAKQWFKQNAPKCD